MNRRSFLKTLGVAAGALYLPYVPQRIYSYPTKGVIESKPVLIHTGSLKKMLHEAYTPKDIENLMNLCQPVLSSLGLNGRVQWDPLKDTFLFTVTDYHTYVRNEFSAIGIRSGLHPMRDIDRCIMTSKQLIENYKYIDGTTHIVTS